MSTAAGRPLWSVMIPTYDRTKYLAQTLNSVLAEGLSPNEMQIEIVDNYSTQNAPKKIVELIAPGRISFYRQPQHISMSANWNTCIERARGQFIHILHDDDFVAPGYYHHIEELANRYPNVGLYATRCFYVDELSIITGVTGRVSELEQPGQSTSPFFYHTPIQCAGVTVRRTSYEALGGFMSDLGYVTDCEMWARVTGVHGAVVSANIMASYRMTEENETARIVKTTEGIRNVCRLNEIFSQRYREFSVDAGRARVSRMAWMQYQTCRLLGEDIAAGANWDIWVQLTPVQHRLARRLSSRVMPYIRRLVKS